MFDVPALRISQLSSQLEYEFSDPSGQQTYGRAQQIGGPQPRKGMFSSLLGPGNENARVVVQAFWPNGAPGFFVDRQGEAPVAVVAPDNTLIGRIVDDQTAKAAPMIARGVSPTMARHMVSRTGSKPYLLLDAAERELCRLEWTVQDNYYADSASHRIRVEGCDYTDFNGVVIARLDVHESFRHKDRYDLVFHYQVPEPLRTLTIASVLAFDMPRG